MGFYERAIFNPAMEFALDRPPINAERARVLAAARGRILEVGVGTGLNFERYPGSVTAITAANLEPALDRRAARRASARGLDIERVQGDAAALPFDSGRFDTVVCTFLLCSVAEPERSLAEFRRVLAPGGRLLFLEHVKSDRPGIGRVQRVLDPVQRTVACGCSLLRDTERAITGAGFTFRELRREASVLPWWLGSLIGGAAER
jgi:ubiquinone/menaquinone biosynthesis C-methylase UbiE